MNWNKITLRAAVLGGAIVLGTGSLALAHGFGGHGHHGHDDGLGLLARAAGVSGSSIGSTFHNNATLQKDFAAVKSAHTALVSCLVTTPSSCTSDITALATAQAQLTTDKMTAWQGLFTSAPNLSNANTVLGELNNLKSQEKALHQQKWQILQGVFGNNKGGSGPQG
ncbi:MAG TPA: hypothetical protein VEJ86_14415 [Candidatus Binataceae bacterium]|nr:hypothetical protein [Candidatus Binataceae bacterium]